MLIGKEYRFEAAHLLPNHGGKCKRLHGHSYKVLVEIGGIVQEQDGSTSEGMVIDYGDISYHMKPIIEAMDHRFLACGDEWPYLIKDMGDENMYYMGVRTTAENIAKHVYGLLYEKLELEPVNWSLKITVKETENTYATYGS